jgi:MFS transporter, DHA3 family, macrolide efflux protein
VLIAGILLGLLLGLRAGGRLDNLANIQLRWPLLLIAAVLVRYGTEVLLNAHVDIVETLRAPLLATGFALLLVALWVNRFYPGLSVAFVGILLNGLVITVNGGHMPIWATSLEAAGLTPEDVTSALHVIVPGEASDFFLHLLILGDIIPIPVPLIQNVASLGDLFLTAGLAFFLFASVVRVPTKLEEHEEAVVHARLAGLAGTARLLRPDAGRGVPSETGLAPSLEEAAALERPLVLGSAGSGLASPALASLPGAYIEPAETSAAPTITLPRPSPETLERVRAHPYVRLGLNGSFTSLWAGQLISLFGDRIHQLALAAAVLVTTGSALATALVFVTATLPNLLFSPIAGTLVDRWDHKDVLVVSDLLRAAVVLFIPIAIVTNIVLVYPLVFLLTTISIFFRPARVAILPQIVRPDELLTANSALWVGETLADVIGYPLAGLFVVALGEALPIAFWLDAATYAASAILLSTIVVRPRGHGETVAEGVAAGAAGLAAVPPAAEQPGAAVDEAEPGFLGELKAGWRFLRREPVLLANTVQAAIAQLTVGVLLALTPVFAKAVFGEDPLGWPAVYALIETGVGAGNLLGGFVIGLIGMRFAKGHMVIAGYAFFGLFITLLALTGNVVLVIGFAFGTGIANMVFVIPSQTLFQERTPPELMGRVVGFRFALVFGAMTFAMALGGVLAEVVSVTVVLVAFGIITMFTGLAGIFVPAVRDA